MSYSESKKELDDISIKYTSAGNVIMRTAVQNIVSYGQYMFTDEEFIAEQIDQINVRHEKAEKDGRVLFITREFELAILECTKELAYIDTYDLIVYMQKEMFWSNEGGLDYGRALVLLDYALDWIDSERSDSSELYRILEDDLDMTDDEIMQLGWGYCVPEETEGEDE